MDRIIYTAMTGANALVHRQQAIAHNLANVSTNGFRAEMSTYRSVPLRGEGATTRVFALDATAGHLDQPGSMQSTGRNLDIAARGNAYFAIQALDGRESYTRAGALQVSADGTLVSATGLPMLDDGGAPLAVPEGAHVSIAADGTQLVLATAEDCQVFTPEHFEDDDDWALLLEAAWFHTRPG